MPGARPLGLVLPLAFLALGAALSPPPWSAVWLAAPWVGGAGYLAGRVWGAWGAVASVGTAAAVVAVGWTGALPGWAAFGTVTTSVLVGWSARWAPETNRAYRLWAFLPLLVAASMAPFSGAYEASVREAALAVDRRAEELFESYRIAGLEGAALEALAAQLEQGTAFLRGLVTRFLPAILFGWCAALVGLTVLLARRACEAVGRPLSPRQPFSSFALPEEAVWLLVVALAAVALRAEPLVTVGRNASACLAVGYALQGLAIGRTAMAARGWRGGMFWVLVLFVFFFAPPILAVGATVLGLSDVWLDLRRRLGEPPIPGREA